MSWWTEEREAELRKRWAEGESCTFIGQKIGTTRNAVIGKVCRLGLDKRQTVARVIQMRPRRDGSQGVAPVFSKVPLPPEPQPPATALRLTLMQLTDKTCKCGLGDPKDADFAFCGLPTLEGSSYCHAHHARFYSTIRTANARKKQKPKAREYRPHDLRFERWAA